MALRSSSRNGSALPPEEEKHRAVRLMFDRIAPRYDLMNRLMTGGMDQRWRRATVEALGVGPCDRVLDLACGTGDLAALVAARGARVLGIDFAGEMLRGARGRGLRDLARADAARLPLADGWASCAACGFALRNFVDLKAVLAELGRVIAPGGRLALLEVDRPAARWLRAAHGLYFDRIVPRLGGLISDRAAYAYLPQSIAYLPPEAELRGMVEAAGFERVRKRSFLLGSAQLLVAERGGQR